MEEKPLDFIQYNVTYSRQGDSNKWPRRIERNANPGKKYFKGVLLFIAFHEGQSIKDAKRALCTVNVKCDPRLNDPNTFGIVPEDLQPYEEAALILTDKEFKKKFPEAEIIP